MQAVPLQVPVVHVPPAQHGSPVLPHSWHCELPATLVHTVPACGHVLPAQHGSPSLPHDAQ